MGDNYHFHLKNACNERIALAPFAALLGHYGQNLLYCLKIAKDVMGVKRFIFRAPLFCLWPLVISTDFSKTFCQKVFCQWWK